MQSIAELRCGQFSTLQVITICLIDNNTVRHFHDTTLDALQFLVSAITVRTMGFRYPVIVDVEGYKNRQREKLESIARNAAAKASKQHRSVKLRPMTPYERRIVHIALRDDERVETASEGEGSARHVVVVPL